MKPGRELDALVAEKVMGLKLKNGLVYAEPSQMTQARLGWTAVGTPPKSYSTDIAAAWSVVERLSADGFGFTFDQSPGDQFAAAFRRGHGISTAASKLPSHAICLAALKACGVELPDTPGARTP